MGTDETSETEYNTSYDGASYDFSGYKKVKYKYQGGYVLFTISNQSQSVMRYFDETNTNNSKMDFQSFNEDYRDKNYWSNDLIGMAGGSATEWDKMRPLEIQTDLSKNTSGIPLTANLKIEFYDDNGNELTVVDPIIHFDNLGGKADTSGDGISASLKITTNDSATQLERISGKDGFELKSNVVSDKIDGTSAKETSAGSLKIKGNINEINIEISQKDNTISTDKYMDWFSIMVQANLSSLDTDKDGIPDYHDLDSDDDGCFDAREGSESWETDNNGEAIKNDIDTDTSTQLHKDNIGKKTGDKLENLGNNVFKGPSSSDDNRGVPKIKGTTSGKQKIGTSRIKSISIKKHPEKKSVCEGSDVTFESSVVSYAKEVVTAEWMYQKKNETDWTVVGNSFGKIETTSKNITTSEKEITTKLTLSSILKDLDGCKFKVKYSQNCDIYTNEVVLEVKEKLIPTFDDITIYVGDANPLPSTSKESIKGTWKGTFSSATKGTIEYTFTPTDKCAEEGKVKVHVIEKLDYDADGVPDDVDLDDDNDGILDTDEGLETSEGLTYRPDPYKGWEDISYTKKKYTFRNNSYLIVRIENGGQSKFNTFGYSFNNKIQESWSQDFMKMANITNLYNWDSTLHATEFKADLKNTDELDFYIDFYDSEGNKANVVDPIIHIDGLGHHYIEHSNDVKKDNTVIPCSAELSLEGLTWVRSMGTDDFELNNGIVKDNTINTYYTRHLCINYGDPSTCINEKKDVIEAVGESSKDDKGTAAGSMKISTGSSGVDKVHIKVKKPLGSTAKFIDTFNFMIYAKIPTIYKDTDKDGIPDYHDLDSDDDGCPDAFEGGKNDSSDPVKLVDLKAATVGKVATDNTKENRYFGEDKVDVNGIPEIVKGGQEVGVSNLVGKISITGQSSDVKACAADGKATFSVTFAELDTSLNNKKVKYRWQFSKDKIVWSDIENSFDGATIVGNTLGITIIGKVSLQMTSMFRDNTNRGKIISSVRWKSRYRWKLE